MRRFALLAAGLFTISLASAARADDTSSSATGEAGLPEAKKGGAETPFVYLTDPTTARAGDVTVGYGVGMASAGAADRPIPVDPTSGIVHALTLGYGVTSNITPFATVIYRHDASSLGGSTSSGASGGAATANAGVKVQLTDAASPFRFTLIGTAFRELDAALGGSLRVATSYDVGRLRVAGNLHVERAFREGRDAIDAFVLAGASVRVVDALRLGAEYVGQDLEDAFEHDAEGGAKHYVGPNAAIDLAGSAGRVQLAFGPAFALNKTAKGAVLARAGLLVAF